MYRIHLSDGQTQVISMVTDRVDKQLVGGIVIKQIL